MKEYYKPLYALFQSMGETAIDIYFGNSLELNKEELKELKPDDYTRAFNNACADLVARSIEATWFQNLFNDLSEYYGNQLINAYTMRVLETGEDEK